MALEIAAFQQHLFEEGHKQGCVKMEVYYEQTRSTSVRVSKGDIDAFTIKETGGVSFRGEFNGKMGYAYSERLETDVIAFLIEEARSNAYALESSEVDQLFPGAPTYPQVKTYEAELLLTAPQLLIDAAMDMERIALAADERITLVKGSSVTLTENEVMIANTEGLNCRASYSTAVGSLSVVATQSGQTTTGDWFDYSMERFEDIDFKAIAHKAVEEAVSKLGADTILSDQYPVIFRHDASSKLLGSYTSIFSAEAVNKGFSGLKDKIGEQIAGSNVTFVDDPLMNGVLGACSFDAEGYACTCTEVIKEGKLLTYLHNGKTASKAGLVSTGHASKGGYRGKIGIAPHNMYVLPGSTALEDMIAGTERGVMIVQLQGLHAGTNAVSGEFSLSCTGFLIEQGKVVRPVNQITVSGNLFEMLKQIEDVGSDIRFTGRCNAPSLKVKGLTISGA